MIECLWEMPCQVSGGIFAVGHPEDFSARAHIQEETYLQCSKLPRNVNHWSLLSRSLLKNRCETEHTAKKVENTGEGGEICSPFLICKVRWRRKEAASRCDTCLGTQVSTRFAGQRLVLESI